MCSNLSLERIAVKEYREHLNQLAIRRWDLPLADDCLLRIMQYTEAHAYYVNLLCSALWEFENLPTSEDVDSAWQLCVKHEKSRIVDELNNLTYSQKDILRSLALYPTDKPTAIKFTKMINRPVSTISQSIKSLLEKDMIYKIDYQDVGLPWIQFGYYRVLDPMVRFMIVS